MTMSVPDRASFGVAPVPTDDDLPELRDVAVIPSIARAAVQAFADESAKIDQDEDLTDTGKRKKRGDVAANAVPEIEGAERAISAAEKLLADQAEKIRLTIERRPTGDALLLAMEVRAIFKAMTPQVRLAEAFKAITSGDVATMRALGSARPEASGLSSSMLNRVRAELVRLDHGTLPERLTRLAQAVGAGKQAIATTRAFLRDHVDAEALKKSGAMNGVIQTMTDAEKSKYIATHGLAAWQAKVSADYGR